MFCLDDSLEVLPCANGEVSQLVAQVGEISAKHPAPVCGGWGGTSLTHGARGFLPSAQLCEGVYTAQATGLGGEEACPTGESDLPPLLATEEGECPIFVF